MSESLFIKVALCFPMNIAKFLRTTFLRKTSIGLLLHGYLVKEICKCFFLVFFHSLRLFFWYLNQTSIFFHKPPPFEGTYCKGKGCNDSRRCIGQTPHNLLTILMKNRYGMTD